MKQAEALGQSEPFLEFQDRLSRVAPVDRPVLLVGERGTGKELAATRLHFLSKRWDGAFITLNCSTLSPTLIESELFGHEKGAFTGAENLKIGRFEAAHGGTLFLDEIGTIPMEAQEKILRVVEYGSFERVGGTQPIDVDVRIVCATNVDLVAMAEQGKFKRDLLDRLSFEVLFLPPLRYRGEDILLLAHHFAARMAYELEKEDDIIFSQHAVSALVNHPWPGNVRELKNVIERAVYVSLSGQIDEITFNPFISPYMPHKELYPAAESAAPPAQELTTETAGGFKTAVSSFEIHLIQQALEHCRYSQKRAADYLELTYDQLRGLLRKYKEELDLD
jgi:psp operon transcriptional activator